MRYDGPIFPDDDPLYVWILKSAEEREAELHARKAELIKRLGLSAEEADQDDEFLQAAASEHNCGTVQAGWEDIMLMSQGTGSAQALREWGHQEARSGMKRVLRASLE